MNTQAPIVDPEVESDPASVTAGVDIAERSAASISSAVAFPATLFLLAGFVYSIYTFVIGAVMSDTEEPGGVARIVAGILLFLLVLVLVTSLAVISPEQIPVHQFFGKCVDTVRRTGPVLMSPLTNGKRVFIKVHDFETNELKVNDSDGNPIDIAAIIVWQVTDTAHAVFVVEEHGEPIRAQAESALRHVTTTHPYGEPDPGGTSLRGGTDLVSTELAEKVASRVALAGLEIVEVRISFLAYAPGIAQTTLRRQQAGAVTAAREQTVEDAVMMVDQTLKRLGGNDIVEFDDEHKVQMVSNLLVVLYSDTRTQPVVSAGSLY